LSGQEKRERERRRRKRKFTTCKLRAYTYIFVFNLLVSTISWLQGFRKTFLTKSEDMFILSRKYFS